MLALYHTMNFNGALLVLKPLRLEASFRSCNFSETAIWVNVEGVPVALSSSRFAEQLLGKIGPKRIRAQASLPGADMAAH